MKHVHFAVHPGFDLLVAAILALRVCAIYQWSKLVMIVFALLGLSRVICGFVSKTASSSCALETTQTPPLGVRRHNHCVRRAFPSGVFKHSKGLLYEVRRIVPDLESNLSRSASIV